MKLYMIFKIAYQNVKNRKKTAVKLLFSLISILIITLTFSSYNIAINNQYKEILESSASVNFIRMSNIDYISDDDYSHIKSFTGIEEIKHTTRKYYNYNLYEVLIENKSIQYTEDINLISINDSQLFSNNEIKEFEKRFPNSSIINGSQFIGLDEVILSYEIASNIFGDINNILGNRITIKNNSNEIIIDNLKVIGITHENYHHLASNYPSSDIYISKKMDDFLIQYFDLYVTDFSVGNDVLKTLKIHFINADISINYYAAVIIARIEYLRNQQILINQIMYFIGLVFIIAIIMSTITNTLYVLKKRTIYFGVLKAVGMQIKDIYKVVFLENIIIFMGAIVSSFTISLAIIGVISNITNSMLGVSLSLLAIDYFTILIIHIVIGIIFMAALSLMQVLCIKNKEVFRII